jgi:molecular chaperone GrpE (heat shock protein)
MDTVVAVEQFGFRRDGRLVRPTRLCGYNPPEWYRA